MRVGYYAHHHGRGHVARACAILAHVRAPATLFTSADVPAPPEGVEVVRLPPDLPRDGESSPPPPLHYAPVAHDGVRQRMARIAAWAAEGPAVLVVDVSVEVALFGRLLSLPVVTVRQHGDRRDAPHEAAYRASVASLAPYAPVIEDPTASDWLREQTVYAGGLSRFAGRPRVPRAEPRTVCLVGGGGSAGPDSGAAWTEAQVTTAAAATPDWRWTWLGTTPSTSGPPNLHRPGWVDDPFAAMSNAEVVITAGGHNATMEAAAAGRPLIVFPEPRPFREQHHKAEALGRIGAALVPGPWPEATRCRTLLASASAMDPTPLRALADAEAAQSAARFLDDLAERYA